MENLVIQSDKKPSPLCVEDKVETFKNFSNIESRDEFNKVL